MTTRHLIEAAESAVVLASRLAGRGQPAEDLRLAADALREQIRRKRDAEAAVLEQDHSEAACRAANEAGFDLGEGLAATLAAMVEFLDTLGKEEA